jgi:hypothetical protein
MMKLYGAILLICLTLPLWGQVHRGDWMLGGNDISGGDREEDGDRGDCGGSIL